MTIITKYTKKQSESKAAAPQGLLRHKQSQNNNLKCPRPGPLLSSTLVHSPSHNICSFDFDELSCMSSSAFSKICSRCGAEYKINVNGSCVRKEECSHHWGRLRRNRGGYVYCVRMRHGRRFCNDRTTASCISVHI